MLIERPLSSWAETAQGAKPAGKSRPTPVIRRLLLRNEAHKRKCSYRWRKHFFCLKLAQHQDLATQRLWQFRTLLIFQLSFGKMTMQRRLQDLQELCEKLQARFGDDDDLVRQLKQALESLAANETRNHARAHHNRRKQDQTELSKPLH